MIATITASLLILLRKFIDGKKHILAVTDGLLLVLSAGVVILAVVGFLRKRSGSEKPGELSA